MILGLAGNRHKEKLPRVLPAFIHWLEERGVKLLISEEFRGLPGLQDNDRLEFVSPEAVGERVDVVLSFGGDGTLLNTVDRLGGREIPVMGVNLGGMGYLTVVGEDELIPLTELLLEKKYRIDQRIILEASVEDDGHGGPWRALNDIVVDKADYGRLIQIRTCIDEVYLNTFRADGLIVATPTGSTGYSLSAGGPILEPNMAGMLLTPLNPHSLSNRPLVVADDKTVQIEASTPAESFGLTVDGQNVARLPSGTRVRVERAPFNACLVNFPGRFFYEVLRRKLGWGDPHVGRG